MKEIEILVEVLEEKENVLEKLKKLDFKGVKKTFDIYYFDPKRDDLKPDASGRLRKCFRLREKGGRFFMAYKIDNFNDKDTWIYSDEHEIEVSDLRTAENIIEHLGLKTLVEIDNEKHIFEYRDYEIIFEDVKNLGLFLEVEKINAGDSEIVDKIKKEIWEFIKSLNIKVGKELNTGKPELMLLKGNDY